MKVEIVDLADLVDDELNPRTLDETRLEAVELSLTRLGHLLPLFADTDGRIVSGHRRSAAARRAGATRVPVVTLPAGDHLLRAARLTAFNLATNDTPDRGPDALTRLGHDLDVAPLIARLAELPELDLDDPANWPALTVTDTPVPELLAANPDVNLGAPEGFEAARALARPPFRVDVPIVTGPAGEILCGRQRLIAATTLGRRTWPTVTAPDHLPADLVRAVLNDLTMTFDLSGFDDVLRASVWLNPVRRRKALGPGFVQWVQPRRWSSFDIRNAKDAERWRAYHGTYVAEVGAGHMIESGLLRRSGVESVPFEPFLIDDRSTPDRDLTRRIARLFLAEIARRRPFDSVFSQYVLNQVPFDVDRFRMLTLVHALTLDPAGPSSCPAYLSTQSTNTPDWEHYFVHGRPNSRARSYDLRLAGPEPGTVLTSIALGRIMVTKHMDADELRHLTRPLWRTVTIEEYKGTLYARCLDPRPLNPELLARSIDHEFDLPWGDGQRLGLVDEARHAFERRFNIALPS